MEYSYGEVLRSFKEIIKKNSMKYTRQRELILETLYNSQDSHFTPESLYLLIKEKYPKLNIGIATVYRTLNLLEESELAGSISFGIHGKKYEFGVKEHHDHIICKECGEILEFIDEEIETRQNEIVKKYGYKIISHNLQIFGICPTCQKK
jgi:Fur family ferric uptake transcriptional regulator